MFFISIAGPTMVLYGLALLAVGVLSLAVLFLRGLSGSLKKMAAIASTATLALAITILYLQVIASTGTWLHYLFGFAVLSFGIALIFSGLMAHNSNMLLSLIRILCGAAATLLSIVMIAFPMVLISDGNPQIYVSYGYFLNIALIIIGIGSLTSGAINMVLSKKQKTHLIPALN